MASDREPCVFVAGGAGYFGRLLVADLLATTRAAVVVTGRSRARLDRLAAELGSDDRLRTVVADVRDSVAWRTRLSPRDVVVDCAGPFQVRGHELVEAAVASGAHYLDIADARDHLVAMRQRRPDWQRSAATVASGISALPALIVTMSAHAAKRVGRVDAIRTWMAPGNREPRRHGTVYSLLSELDRPFPTLVDGRALSLPPWSRPAKVRFPPPIGLRTGYCISGADAAVLPEHFPAVRTCEFRVSAELGLFHAAIAALRPLARLSPRAMRAAVPLCRTLMAALGWLGHSAGGMLVRVDGVANGCRQSCDIAITAAERAPRIAIVPASLLAAHLLGAGRDRRGWLPLDAWSEEGSWIAAFRGRGCEVAWREASATDDARPEPVWQSAAP